MDKKEIYDQLIREKNELSEMSSKLFINKINSKQNNLVEDPDRISKTAFPPQYILDHGIENYIEKGCIEACKKLWDLNIYTFESSNNKAYPYAWIDLFELSSENQKIFDELKKRGKARINPFTGTLCLTASLGETAEIEFLESISHFNIQDIPKSFYNTEEEFIDTMKRTNGKTYILEDGTIAREINPEYKNLSLEEALLMSGKSHLYDKESGRIFEDTMSYQGYLNYQAYVKTQNRKN